MAPAYRFLVRRDARYLRWRYLECPDVPYFVVAIRKWRRLVGWSVFRVRDERLAWGDALFDPRYPDAVEVLLRHVVPSLSGRSHRRLVSRAAALVRSRSARAAASSRGPIRRICH